MSNKIGITDVVKKLGIECEDPEKVGMFSILENFFFAGARSISVTRAHGNFVVVVEDANGEIYASKDDSFQAAVLTVAAKALKLNSSKISSEETSNEDEPEKKPTSKKRVARKG